MAENNNNNNIMDEIRTINSIPLCDTAARTNIDNIRSGMLEHKQLIDSKADKNHAHPEYATNINSFMTLINNKADKSHTHSNYVEVSYVDSKLKEAKDYTDLRINDLKAYVDSLMTGINSEIALLKARVLKLEQEMDKEDVVIPTIYSIAYQIGTGVTLSNTATTINEDSSYFSILTYNALYECETIRVTMNGIDITNEVVLKTSDTQHAINIVKVQGNININIETKRRAVACTGVSLYITEYAFTEVGETQKNMATVTPSNCTETIVWSSTNNAVVTVDQTGLMTAKGSGSCLIIATCGSKTASCNVAVNIGIPCSGLTFDKLALTLRQLNATDSITPIVTPSDCTEEVLWFSNNTSVATINNGVVRAVGEGTCTITATCGLKSASCTVTVDFSVKCTGISLYTKTMRFYEIGATNRNIVSVNPINCTEPVVWSSSNVNIARVDQEGHITSVGEGVCTITATCGDYSETCAVTVDLSIDCTGLTLSTSSTSISPGGTYEIVAYPTPEDCTDSVVWELSDKDVLSVTNDLDRKVGIITGKKPGRCTVTAICGDYSATCNVTVNEIKCEAIAFKQQSVTVNASSSTINMKQYLVLTPSNTTDPVTWYCDNTDLNYNANTGIVTLRTGSYKIQARCNNMAATINLIVN